MDAVAVLTESDYQTARNYWKVLKNRLKKEGNESVTNLGSTQPETFSEHSDVARRGGNIACEARLRLEKETGKPVISFMNENDYLQLEDNTEE